MNRGRISTIAFGTVLAMWAAAYVLLFPKLGLGDTHCHWAAAVASGLIVLLGGFVTGRRCVGAAAAAGVKLGAAVGLINLLVLASLLGRDADRVDAAVLIGGCTLVTIVLAVAGSLIAGSLSRGSMGPSAGGPVSWTSRLARTLAATTLTMLIAGGIVTGLEAGLAIDGWLNVAVAETHTGTNGNGDAGAVTDMDIGVAPSDRPAARPDRYPLVLLPLSEMRRSPGAFAEHAHRLLGLLVGLLAIVLTFHVWATRPRLPGWVRGLALATLLAVIVQGVLGGLRVTATSTTMAIVHGVLAQVIFAAMALLATATSSSFDRIEPVREDPRARRHRLFSAKLVILLLVQLVLGATFRHLHGPDPSGLVHAALGLHILLGLSIGIVVVMVAGNAGKAPADHAALRRLGRWLLVLVSTQILLGMGAAMLVLTRKEEAIPAIEVITTTAHHTIGALLLATATSVMVRTRRHYAL